MENGRILEGTCLCQSVSLKTEVSRQVGACHCSMCRTWGGGPLLATDCGSGLQFSGQEHITVYDSSEWAERGFCKHCGTHVFYRIKQSDEYVLPVGFFKDQSAFEFKQQIFIDHKPDFYKFANETHNLTEAEVFAKYIGES